MAKPIIPRNSDIRYLYKHGQTPLMSTRLLYWCHSTNGLANASTQATNDVVHLAELSFQGRVGHTKNFYRGDSGDPGPRLGVAVL